MLVLNPRSVTFGAVTWSNVAAVAIDRQAARLVEETGDAGPHVVLADVPEQRVRVKVVQEFARDEMSAPRPGEQAVLTFVTAPGGGAGTRRVTITAVVIGVDHELSARRGAVRTIALTAISSNGTTDPIAIANVTP